MKSLDQHNSERSEAWAAQDALVTARPNGIECPQCKAELVDSAPGITLLSNPPKKDIHCEKCGYRGYRVA